MAGRNAVVTGRTLHSGLVPVVTVAVQFGRAFPQGLKPIWILRLQTYGLKPVPFKLHRYRGSGGSVPTLFGAIGVKNGQGIFH